MLPADGECLFTCDSDTSARNATNTSKDSSTSDLKPLALLPSTLI